MSRPSFSETEKKVRELFKKGTQFTFEGKQWTVLECAKPRPSSGECKTDVYLRVGRSDDKREIKISVKQTNAEFFENKMSYSRAQEVFGKDVDKILSDSLISIKDKFDEQCLIHLKQFGHTEAKSIKLGWRFDFVNKKSAHLSGELKLTKDQLIDVYSGTNLDDGKRNARVNDEVVADSGVANYFLILDPNKAFDMRKCIEGLTKISDYVNCHQELFFTCRALNYRVSESKWDGNRPLFVYVNWDLANGKLKGDLKFSEPLKKKGNEIGGKVKSLLQQLNISADNFDSIRDVVDNSVRIYPASNDDHQ